MHIFVLVHSDRVDTDEVDDQSVNMIPKLPQPDLFKSYEDNRDGLKFYVNR